MDIVEIDVTDIRPNPWNPNVMPPAMMEHLKKEYKRVGYIQPIVVRPVEHEKSKPAYEMVDGEHRWKIGIESGFKTMKAVVVKLSDEEAKITTVNLNRIKGADDPFKLADLLKDLNQTLELDQISELLNMPITELETMFELSDATEDIMKDKPQLKKYIIIPMGKKPGDKVYLDEVDVLKDGSTGNEPVPAG